MSAFPKNLGRNFVGVFSGQNLLPFAVGAAATTASSAFDYKTQDLLQGACQACGQTGARVGGAAMVPIVTSLFVAGRFAPQGRFRAMTYDFGQALIVNAAYSGLLKYTVQRPRPYGSDKLSFPSGHTSTAFSLAAVAKQHYGWKVGVPAFAFASCIGLTRIESTRHNLSDVLAGATLGIIVGRTVGRLDGDRPPKKRTVSLAPTTDAQNQFLIGAAGLALVVSASKSSPSPAARRLVSPGVVAVVVLALLPLAHHRVLQDLAREPWYQVQVWARNHTPRDALFLTPPYREGCRVFSERPVVGELKDGTQQFFSSAFAFEWWRRMQVLKGRYEVHDELSPEAVLALARDFHADYVVVRAATSLPAPQAYRNEAFAAYGPLTSP